MLDALNIYWREYMMEAIGLAGFIVISSLVTTLLEHPDLFVMRGELGHHPLLRRIPLGLVIGVYLAVVVRLFGKRSGAHINPAVTLALLLIGKIDKRSAFFYLVAQFGGALLGALLMSVVLGTLYQHPSIHYVTTNPGSGAGATAKAFVAEFAISFVLLATMLVAGTTKPLEKYAPVIVGVLLAIYLIAETPYSGMSMNPARSFASAFVAGHWRDLWIYFTAPTAAMLSAATLFALIERRWLRGASWHKEHPIYPILAPAPVSSVIKATHA